MKKKYLIQKKSSDKNLSDPKKNSIFAPYNKQVN